MQISASGPEIFKFEKRVKYPNEMTDDVTDSTQHYIKQINTGGDNSNKRWFGTKPKLFREFGDFCGNRDTWKFFRETRDNSGRLQKKIGTSKEILFDVSPKFGRMIKFPGRLNLRLSIAQTAFVRVVTPR